MPANHEIVSDYATAIITAYRKGSPSTEAEKREQDTVVAAVSELAVAFLDIRDALVKLAQYKRAELGLPIT